MHRTACAAVQPEDAEAACRSSQDRLSLALADDLNRRFRLVIGVSTRARRRIGAFAEEDAIGIRGVIGQVERLLERGHVRPAAACVRAHAVVRRVSSRGSGGGQRGGQDARRKGAKP